MVFTLPGSEIHVAVERKRISSFRLRVSRDGVPRCSVPLSAPRSAVEHFILSRAQWIEDELSKAREQIVARNSLPPDSIALKLGLSAADCADGVFSAGWKSCVETVFSDSVQRMSAHFSPGALPEFSLRLRSLKSLWGSCNLRTKTVTLNYALLRFPPACVDYVVFHELVHFLYIHHDKKFYKYIEEKMPDYKSHRALLNG